MSSESSSSTYRRFSKELVDSILQKITELMKELNNRVEFICPYHRQVLEQRIRRSIHLDEIEKKVEGGKELLVDLKADVMDKLEVVKKKTFELRERMSISSPSNESFKESNINADGANKHIEHKPSLAEEIKIQRHKFTRTISNIYFEKLAEIQSRHPEYLQRHEVIESIIAMLKSCYKAAEKIIHQESSAKSDSSLLKKLQREKISSELCEKITELKRTLPELNLLSIKHCHPHICNKRTRRRNASCV